jgi:hypothetical protein
MLTACAGADVREPDMSCSGGENCDDGANTTSGGGSADNDVPLDPAPTSDAGLDPHGFLVVPPPPFYAPIYDDLIWWQSPAKSQGGRNLCTVFATTAMMEYLAIANGLDDAPDYSEQWLFWLAQTQYSSLEGSAEGTGYSRVAANIAAAQAGIPSDDAWPYESQSWSPSSGHPECTGSPQPLACYTDGDPSKSGAPEYAFMGTLSGIAPSDIKAWLATHESPVIASTTVYCRAWNLSCGGSGSSLDYYHAGWITYPDSQDTVAGGHEFLIVGWDDVTEVPVLDAHGNPLYEADGFTPTVETGFYIIKNSWTAKGFGRDNLYATGFGLLPERYMEDFPSTAAVVNDDATVAVVGTTP